MAADFKTGDVAGRVHAIGPLRVTTPDGRDCTPKGAFRQAIFAILLFAPRGERSRIALQTLLWPSKDPKKAQTSLRNALSVLRKDIAALGPDLVTADDHLVRLDLTRFWVDVFELQGTAMMRDAAAEVELLEGLDLKSGDDDAFEEWLRMERAVWAERAAERPPPGVHKTKIIPALPDVSLVDQPLILRLDDGGDPKAKAVLHAIAADCAEIAPTDVQGDRAQDEPPHLDLRAWIDGGRLKVVGRSDSLRRDVFALEADLPHGVAALELPQVLLPTVQSAADKIALAREEVLSRDPELAKIARHALQLVFQLDPASRARARDYVARMARRRPDPIYSALTAYFETIEVGEDTLDGEPSDEQVLTAIEASRQSDAGDAPGLFLTLAGYSLDFLAADADRAGALMQRAVQISPELPIAWDHLAMTHFWRGDYTGASASAQRAVALGGESPLLGTYETSLCLAATIRGDYRRAAYYGRRALARPEPLNDVRVFYLSALGHLGRLEEARAFIESLDQDAPGMSIAQVENRAEVRMTPEGRTRLLEGLKKAGLKQN